MEKDISLILLVVAGIILLFLFAYSFRNRADKYEYEAEEAAQPAEMKNDDEEDDDILLPSEDKYYKTKPAQHNSAIEKLPQDRKIFIDDYEEEFEPTPKASFNFNKKDIDFIDSEIIVKPKQAYQAPSQKPAATQMKTVSQELITPVLKENVNIIKIEPEQKAEVKNKVAPLKPEELAQFKPSPILTLYVLPKNGERFVGFDLLQGLLAANLRFGKMSIFHRHSQAMGKGDTLFSVAQATEPGIFNMNTIGSCHCAGLVMFMQLKGSEHNFELLQQFIQTAHQLAENLGGAVFSSKRETPFTADTEKQLIASVQHHLQNLNAMA